MRSLTQNPRLFSGMLLPVAAAAALVGCASNTAPTTPGVALGPVEATSSDDLVLQLDGEAADEDGDAVSLNIAWFVDGQYRSDLEDERTVPAELTGKGQEWSVTVTPFDGQLKGDPASASITVGNTAPTAEISQVPFAPDADASIEVSAETFDVDGDAVTLTWSWTVDGADAGIATPFVPAERTARGQVWEVTAVPTDGETEGEPVTATIDIANRRPTVSAVTLAPSRAFETTVLTASGVAFDPDGDATNIDWTWYVNGVEVEATGPTLDGASFDRGDAVVAVAVANDGFVDGAPSPSEAVEIQNSVPTLATVQIDQTDIVEGTDVTCAYTGFEDADGDEDATRISWEVSGRPSFEGATLPGNYFDRGDQIVCVATPSDGLDDGRAVRSAPILVRNTLPVIGSVTLSTLSPAEGDVISATIAGTTDDDGDEVSFAYAWSVNGTVVSTSDTLGSELFNKGDTIVLSVTPNDGLEDGLAVASAAATAINTLPVVDSVSLSPTSPDTDDLLTAAVTASDIDGDELTFTYTWTVSGSVVSGQTGPTLAGEFFVKTDEVSVSVVPNDGDADGAALGSSAVTVINTAPEFTAVAVAPATAFEETILTCTPSGWSDLDDDEENYDYDWTVNGTSVATTETLDGSLFSKGDLVACAATANDLDDTGNTLTSTAVEISNTLPTLDDVTLSSTAPLPGDTLTATAGSTDDADGDTVTVEYAWTIDGTAAGTGATLDLTGVAKDAVVVVTATPSDDEGAGSAVTATATVANTPPVISAVTLSPSEVRAGETITASVTATDADSDALTFSYVWSVDGSVVAGETGATLSTGFVRDQDVTVEVVANDGDDDSPSFTSTALTISNTAPSLDAATLDLAVVLEGDTVTCVPGTFTDADGDTAVYTYAWSTGATTASIDGTAFDKGDVISCTITPGDGTDTGTPVTSPSVTIGNTAPTLASVTIPTTITVEGDVTPVLGATADVDGDTVTVSYAWTVDGTAAGTDPTLPASAFKKGQTIGLSVTPNDGEDDGTAVVASTVIVGNTAPTVTSVSLSPTEPGTDDAITATVVSDDVDEDDTLTTTYAWTVEGVTVAGATSATLAASNFAKGDEVEVTVTVDDGTATASSTASVTIGNTAPTAPTVLISAIDLEDDEDLVCAIATAATDADGDTITYTVSWQVDGVDYAGTTSTTTNTGDTIPAAETTPEETWSCTVVANDGTEDSAEASAEVDIAYCTVVITATDSVTVDYDDESVDDSDEVTVGLDTGVDAVGWYQFDLSTIDDTATVRSAVLSAFENGGGAIGTPTIEVAVSDDDGWVPSTLTFGNLSQGDTVSDGGLSTLEVEDFNDFELDVSDWSYTDDLSDDEVSFGLFTDTTGTLATFSGPDETGEEPTLTITLESCD